MESFKFKKAYGQNFLHDQNIINNIVKEAHIKENSLVIEIGCGSGILTKELAKCAKYVLGYEIDTRLESMLDDNLSSYHNVEIILDDFLKHDIKSDVEKYDYENLYVVANIPYYITTPIITKLINSKLPFNSITLMMQKEVGERFNAKVGTREYSSITVYLNYYFDIKKLFVVDRNCFTPKPNVDSIVISLNKKENILKVNNEDLFFQLIRDSFQYKRKNIRNNLKKYNLDKVQKVLEHYGKDLTCRAEELELEVFVDIANELYRK